MYAWSVDLAHLLEDMDRDVIESDDLKARAATGTGELDVDGAKLLIGITASVALGASWAVTKVVLGKKVTSGKAENNPEPNTSPELASGGKTPLPGGGRKGSSAGAAFNATGGLPDGYRRVINKKQAIWKF